MKALDAFKSPSDEVLRNATNKIFTRVLGPDWFAPWKDLPTMAILLAIKTVQLLALIGFIRVASMVTGLTPFQIGLGFFSGFSAMTLVSRASKSMIVILGK